MTTELVDERSAETRPAAYWHDVEQSEAFRELVMRRRRYVVPFTALALGWWAVFVLLVSYAHDFMGSSIYEGFTVAYALGLSQFLVVWLVTWGYLRTSTRVLVPLEQRVVREEGER